jgi:hypothetical protein
MLIDVNRINRQDLSNVSGFCRPGTNSNHNDDDDFINNNPTCCFIGNALDLCSGFVFWKLTLNSVCPG